MTRHDGSHFSDKEKKFIKKSRATKIVALLLCVVVILLIIGLSLYYSEKTGGISVDHEWLGKHRNFVALPYLPEGEYFYSMESNILFDKYHNTNAHFSSQNAYARVEHSSKWLLIEEAFGAGIEVIKTNAFYRQEGTPSFVTTEQLIAGKKVERYHLKIEDNQNPESRIFIEEYIYSFTVTDKDGRGHLYLVEGKSAKFNEVWDVLSILENEVFAVVEAVLQAI